MSLVGLFGPPNIEELEAKRDIQGLIKILSYRKSEDARLHAADALGRIRDLQAVEPLIAALRDPSIHVRGHAAVALGEIGDARAVEPLLNAGEGLPWLDPWKDWLHQNATQALGKIGDKRAVEPLLQSLDNSADHHMVIWALGKIGDSRAVKPLVKLALHESASAWLFHRGNRRDAVVALGEIGDPRAVRPLVEILTARYVGWVMSDVVEFVSLAREALERILMSSAASMPVDDLRVVARVQDYTYTPGGTLDYSRLRILATAELARRGEKVEQADRQLDGTPTRCPQCDITISVYAVRCDRCGHRFWSLE